MDGWIKLHRKIRENPIFNDMHLFRLWIICLTEVAHKERDQIIGKQIVHLLPGQFITGRFDLHEMFNRGLKKKEVKPPTTIWRWLEALEINEYLVINSNNKFTVVSIPKWQDYQSDGQENGQQVVNKRSTDGQQVVTNKNVKNLKNEKNERNKEKDIVDGYTSNPKLIETLHSFIEFRKKIKKPLTEKAVSLLVGNLDKLATSDEDKVSILEQSILNGWQGVFALKGGMNNAVNRRNTENHHTGIDFGF